MGAIDPVGMTNASTTKARKTNARIKAMTIDSMVSLTPPIRAGGDGDRAFQACPASNWGVLASFCSPGREAVSEGRDTLGSPAAGYSVVGFGPEESFLAKSRRILSGHAAPVSAAAVRNLDPDRESARGRGRAMWILWKFLAWASGRGFSMSQQGYKAP